MPVMSNAQAIVASLAARHDRIAFMMSAGKDSAACLKLLRPHIDKVRICWANPGDPYPEVVDYMRAVAASVPSFTVALGSVRDFWRTNGHPADVVPWEATPAGMACEQESPAPVSLVQPHECRLANMWLPARKWLIGSGCTAVVRGDKLCDRPRPQLLPSDLGKEYCYPLADWSHADVFAFLGDDLPPGYAGGSGSSLDCMRCTAYLAKGDGRIDYLRRNHPEAFREIVPVLQYIKRAAQDACGTIDNIINTPSTRSKE